MEKHTTTLCSDWLSVISQKYVVAAARMKNKLKELYQNRAHYKIIIVHKRHFLFFILFVLFGT